MSLECPHGLLAHVLKKPEGRVTLENWRKGFAALLTDTFYTERERREFADTAAFITELLTTEKHCQACGDETYKDSDFCGGEACTRLGYNSFTLEDL